ncbi:NADH-quinone oxidoreductase subunit C [Streptomyces cyaneofuscatus]|uniref:NADH-quinone oxidoreductase subunit C n=1 Tax=Streptomyces cyaneofuscatus TaxID=66883 RepID=UPI0036DD0F5E
MSERQHEAHHPYDRLPDAVTELFGEGATAESAYDLLTVDVPATEWITALRTARDELGCSYFDWLSAVDEPGTGFRVCAHVAALGDGTVRRLMLRTTVPHEAAVLPSAIDVYAGAAWHERETHEMFGVAFEDHPGLAPLLLPEGFEGHPLRKDFVLAARVAKAWPGAKEPGESEHGGPKRRTMLPPGVPDPNEWGPLKGQLPPATTRPGRTARPAATATDRPPRRTRSATEGSAAQRPQTGPPEASGPGAPESGVPAPGAPAPEAPAPGTPAPGGAASGPSGAASPEAVQPPPATTPPGDASPGDVPPPAARPRRSRSASDGSASQQQPPEADAPRPQRRSRSASQGSASQRARATDAPWHDAQPAFDDPDVSPGGPEAPAQSRRPSDDGPEAPSESQRPSGGGPEAPSESQRPSGDGPEAPSQPRRPSDDGSEEPSRPPKTSEGADAPSQPRKPSDDDPGTPPQPQRSSDDGPEAANSDAPSHPPKPSESGDTPSQPLRRLRSGGPGAEPPVWEGAGRGEAPRSGPTPDPTEPRTTPDPDPDRPPTDEATPTKPEPEPEPQSQPKLNPDPNPDPDNPHPAGGDTE